MKKLIFMNAYTTHMDGYLLRKFIKKNTDIKDLYINLNCPISIEFPYEN